MIAFPQGWDSYARIVFRNTASPQFDDGMQGLRQLCTDNGALLCFDEVMTGFRIAKGCAQEHFGITPDLTTVRLPRT